MAAPSASAAIPQFSTVTEIGGEEGSRMQIERAYHRYAFAASFCADKDVLELGCGVGQGLGLLARRARRVVGVDIDPNNVAKAMKTYAGRPKVEVTQGDAQSLPYADGSFDVAILYEALYYLPSVDKFIAEMARVLRPGGVLLLCTANKDLPDFNPSPFSHRYLNAPELVAALTPSGFDVSCYGYDPVVLTSRARLLVHIKRFAVRFHLMPKSMKGKKWLKRLVFGRLVTLPHEILPEHGTYSPPASLDTRLIDQTHRAIYAVAKRA